MNPKDPHGLNENIQNEIDFARAVTALMMAIKLDVSDTRAHRAEKRLDSGFRKFEADIDPVGPLTFFQCQLGFPKPDRNAVAIRPEFQGNVERWGIRV